MLRFLQSANLLVSFELFKCGVKTQSKNQYKGDGLFAIRLQRAYDPTGSKCRSLSGPEKLVHRQRI